MEAPEEEGEERTQQPGSLQVPPIATTPPRPGWKEELISQSSSGTHVSNASGISLGEAIRRQSAINREMEAWYQPYADIDTSNLIAAIERTLGQTSGASGLTEFPTMEGGLITPTEKSRTQHPANLTHTPLLEVQESRLSPNIPLLMTYSTQDRTLFNETLFQPSGMDFAPLRGTPDVSDVLHETSRPLQMNEAEQIAAQDVGSTFECSSLSQHPFLLSTMAPSNASPDNYLSQYPLSFTRAGPVEQRYDSAEQLPHFALSANALVSKDGSFQILGSQKLLNQQLVTSLPSEEPQRTVSNQDLFLLDSSVPAPLLLEILEKEMGLSKHCGLSSSESSSCKSVLGKDAGENETSWLTENIVLAEKAPETFVIPHSQDGRTVPELESSKQFCDSEGKPFANPSLSEQLPVKTSQVVLPSKEYGMGLGDSCLITGMLPRPLLDKQQQVSEVVFEGPKQELASARTCSRHNTPALFQPVTVSIERTHTYSKQENAAPLGIQARLDKNELTLSDYSIEREHKYTGISPSSTEGLFFGSLAHPINHSTPGIVAARALKQKIPGTALLVQSALQLPLLSSQLETSTTAHAASCVPSVEKPCGPSGDDSLLCYAEEPLILQSGQEAKTENSESLQALHPLKGRIQSLPSLNFMEKVGVWNTSQSAEKMSDALVLQSLSSISPKQKAHSAIADSLNRILLKQQSQMECKEGLAAPFSASSLASLRNPDKKSCAVPLTRSRSENSVITVGKEIFGADVGDEIEPDDDLQPVEDEDTVLGATATKQNDAEAEDPLMQSYTAVLVSTVLSDEDTVESVGGERDLNHFITSERVAELLREEGITPSDDPRKSDGCRGDTGALPCAHLSSSQLSMDHFSDVSPDSLNQIPSSVASSCADVRLSPRQASDLSGKSQSSLEDISVSRSPLLKTPDDREINIEERIPVYLRNLGIDQSPSSILTPFLPRGPIREIEFSPSEFGTMKASADALRQRLQTSEGESHSMEDVTHSSIDSSTLSAPVPAGSNAGPETSLPTDFLPKPSRDQLSQCSVDCQQRESHAPTPRPPESISEVPTVPQPTESSQGVPTIPPCLFSAEERSTKHVQVLVTRFSSEELGVSQEKWSSSSLSEEKGERSECGELHALHVISSEEEENDSFIGSKTLKEIQELLAQGEARSPCQFNPVSSVSSSVDLPSALTGTKKVDSCRDFRSVQGNRPVLQRMWSWDESLARQNVHEDHLLSKTLNFTGSLRWDGVLSRDSISNEPLVPGKLRAASEEEGIMKSAERSDPEGCNSAVGDRNLPLHPVVLKSTTGSSVFSLKELQTASAAEPSGSCLNVLEGFQQISEKAGETGSKGTGSIHGSENSSSVDSLGIRVKNVLQGEYPGIHATKWTGGEDGDRHRKQQVPIESSLAFSREGTSVRESDHSSSLDSLAARVRTLLENERPVMHATQILQSAEEEEKKARIWVKLKLGEAESPNSVFDLNEKDRRKIEEIKTELLRSARKAEIQDPLWGSNCEGISNHSPIQKSETGSSIVPNDTELQMGVQAQNLHAAVFPVPVKFVCGTDCAFPSDSEVKTLNSVQSYIYTQTCSNKPLKSSTIFHAHSGPDSETSLSVLRAASKVHTEEEGSTYVEAASAAGSSLTEGAKQISSITFASRKRPSSPPVSPVVSAGLTEATPCGLATLEAKSIGREQLETGKLPVEAPDPGTSVSATARNLEDNVGYSSDRDRQPVCVVVRRDGSPKRKGIVLEENSQTHCIEPKVHSGTEKRADTAVASQDLIGLRRNYRLLGGDYGEKVDPGRRMTENVPQQKTEGDYPQDQLAGSLGSFVHISKPLSPKNKENPWTTESTLNANSYLNKLGDADTKNSVLLPSSFPDHVSTVMPVSPSSPTRKALSGVHITLSPKHISLDFPSLAATEAEVRQSNVKTGPHPATSSAPNLLLETSSNIKLSEVYPEIQGSAYFPRSASSPGPSFGHLNSLEVAKVAVYRSGELLESRLNCSIPDQENAKILGAGGQNQDSNFKVTVSSQTERLSSDAITQITTVSPEKTTYSAEIFVSTDNGQQSVTRSSHWKSHEILSTTTPALNQVSISNRQADKALLLPYKPPGSSEMYYVPCPKETLRLSRVRSETTVESSHSGSNDAIPPEFPAQALGSRDQNPQGTIAIKHREGIYSKMAAPKVAWAEEKRAAQECIQGGVEIRNPLESVQGTHSVFRSAEFYLHHPVPLQHEIDFLPGNETLEPPAETERPVQPSRGFFQYKGTSESSQAPFSLHQPPREQRFSPLIAEPDYSWVQELTVKETCERDSLRKEARPDASQAKHHVAKELPLPGSQMNHVKDQQVADLPQLQSVNFNSSLDELWSKYLERRQQQRNELSLVERLDRLARLLQNPVRHALMPMREEQSNIQEKGRRKEPKKTRSQRKTQGNQSNLASQVEGSHDTTDATRLSKSRRCKTGSTKVAAAASRNLEQSQNAETPSDTSSETRPCKDSSVLTDTSTSESDAVTQEEASGSVSSIDTARLIRAFGHNRVCISPKLSHLYTAINLQKTRSEKWAKGSRKALGADHPKAARPEHKRKGTEATYPASSSDSVSTTSSSQGPSSALSNKRTTRMLNKAVQAGDFEIVNSATKKHTRDVGLTFPTPTPSQVKLQEDRWNGTEDELTRPGSRGTQKRQPSGLLAERRAMRNKLKWLQGVSWFVPAEELKSDPKKETRSNFGPDPGPSWFEPVSGTKPWREPLREKNWPEDPGGLQVRLTAPARDVENEPPPPYVKMSLQEALALCRPDFISRSGERVKRLKLVTEERKLQSMLQSEREQLFNPPGKRRAYRNGSGLVSNRGYRAVQSARSIPKNEMVQRSKRIYEQLPEVRKRREEEKRKSDYLTYRLKAQLYKTKITNRILGRKVPWE